MQDSVAETGEVTRAVANAFQDFGFVVTALGTLSCIGFFVIIITHPYSAVPWASRGAVPRTASVCVCLFLWKPRAFSLLRPPFSSAVAAHRSHTACFHLAREVGQNQRNTSVFKAF